MGDAADELAHRRELLGLLQLRIGTPLLAHVAHEGQDLADLPALAHGGVDDAAQPHAAVRVGEGDLEPAHLAAKRRVEVRPHVRGGVPIERLERRVAGGRPRRRMHRDHGACRGVLVEDPAFRVEHDDGVGDGLHQRADVVLGGGGGGERIHQRAGLRGDFALEQRRIAAVGAEGGHHLQAEQAARDDQQSRDQGSGPELVRRDEVGDHRGGEREGGRREEGSGEPAAEEHGNL